MLNVQTGFLDVPGTRLYYEVAGTWWRCLTISG